MEFSPHNSMKKAGVHSQVQNPGSGLQYKVLNDCVTNASQNIANVGLSVKSPSMDASHKSCYSESKKHTCESLDEYTVFPTYIRLFHIFHIEDLFNQKSHPYIGLQIDMKN